MTRRWFLQKAALLGIFAFPVAAWAKPAAKCVDPPTISGSTVVGATLTVTPGKWVRA